MERGQRFKRRALRRGYKADEVDGFLDRVEATISGEDIDDPVGPDEVRDIIFKTRWGGYDEWHVDMELDRLERQLEELMDDPSSVRGSSGFPALGQRKSLALPAGSSASAPKRSAERAELSPGVYRSSATSDDFSFEDLGAPARIAPTAAVDAHTNVSTARGANATSGGAVPHSRSAPNSGSPASPRPRLRNVTPRPTPGPSVVDPQWAANAAEASAAPQETVHRGSALQGTVPPSSISARTARSNGSARSLPQPRVDPYAPRHGKTEMTMEVPTYGGNVSPFTQADKGLLAKLRETFKLRRFGSGYEPSQVERLWDAIAAAMDGQASAQVNSADFDPSQFSLVQGGYFEQEVDAALLELRDLFHHRIG